MTKTVLKESIREDILTDVELQTKIAKATGRTIESVKRWARINNELLLLTTVADQIRAHKKLPPTAVLTEVINEDEVLAHNVQPANS